MQEICKNQKDQLQQSPASSIKDAIFAALRLIKILFPVPVTRPTPLTDPRLKKFYRGSTRKNKIVVTSKRSDLRALYSINFFSPPKLHFL